MAPAPDAGWVGALGARDWRNDAIDKLFVLQAHALFSGQGSRKNLRKICRDNEAYELDIEGQVRVGRYCVFVSLLSVPGTPLYSTPPGT
jgi:hypothetical protein